MKSHGGQIQFLISALIVFARFWRILRVINGVIVGTKADADTRARYLKKKISLLENHEVDNQAFQESLQEAIEENARLNLLRRVFKYVLDLTNLYQSSSC